MAVTIRLDPISRDIEFMIDDLKDASGQRFAELARGEINKAKENNRQILGRVPPNKTYVNGQEDPGLTSVKPQSTIVVEFELVSDVLIWIAQQLEQHSPVKGGRYKRSHILLADGTQVEPSKEVPVAEEYVFTNTVPYARKLERGASSQAPDGVYQAVAVLARRRFGNIARINFSYRTVIGGGIITGRQGNRAQNRSPAVVVRIRA